MRVKLRLAPGGAGCRHVDIQDLDGKVLDRLTRDDWTGPDLDEESAVRRAVKQRVRQVLRQTPGATLQQIRAAVEAEDL